MTYAAAEFTHSVSELCEEIHTLLAESFPSAWVAGEVQRVRRSQRGHLYFELAEKGAGDEIAAKLDAVIWRTDLERISRLLAASGQSISEGVDLRCRAAVDFYPPGGRLQLVVREVDPLASLGLLERRRRQTLAELAAAGVLDQNRGLSLPDLPLEIALVTSQGSAAYHDFLTTLRESGYGFRVLFVHASVQGKSAEREIASALASLAGSGVACAVLIRGGGSRSDLAVFDSREVAFAVARAPFPVLTGLGHEIDQAITDRVAHTAARTPTKAAELLVELVGRAERRLSELQGGLRSAALLPLDRGRHRLALAEHAVTRARHRLEQAGARLAEIHRSLGRAGLVLLSTAAHRRRALAERLRLASPRLLERRENEPRQVAARLAAASRGQLRTASRTLAGLERLCTELGPGRTLRRGFTITRTAAGALLRSPAATVAGERILTETAGGPVASRVEAFPVEVSSA